MLYNFDQIIDRHNTNSIKYDFAKERGMPEDIQPMWVADMDFQTPACVISALEKTVRHGIFGYSDHTPEYLNSLHSWFSGRFNWDFKNEWLVKVPGVVFAIATAIKAFTKENDSILIQQPVYHPFASTIKANKRRLIVSLLKRSSDNQDADIPDADNIYANDYVMDFVDFEQKIIDNKVKLFLLCSPHNPVGRVWTIDELRQIADICLRHKVLVLADEIHADFVYAGHSHSIFPSLGQEISDRTILCTSPGKTFNLAGLQIANIFIADPDLRQLFLHQMRASGYSDLGITGIIACQSAYADGAQWLDELLGYLQGNLDFIENFLRSELAQVKMIKPQGTYLLWLDFRSSLPDDQQRRIFLAEQAKLWLSDGPGFGKGGSGYERLNFACPRSVLAAALKKLKVAFDNFL